jgi:hypothetical protein
MLLVSNIGVTPLSPCNWCDSTISPYSGSETQACKARHLANQAFDEAIVELDTMSEESYWEKIKIKKKIQRLKQRLHSSTTLQKIKKKTNPTL